MRLTLIRVYNYKVTKLTNVTGKSGGLNWPGLLRELELKTNRRIAAILLRPHFLL